MLRRTAWIGLCLLPVTLGPLMGCSGMKQPYPAKRHFGLDTGERAEDGEKATPRAQTLRVRRFRVAPPYNNREFTYKVGASEYKTDYYHEFIAAPASLVTAQAIRWLSNSGVFREVMPGSSAADDAYLLEGTVTVLCGDYSNMAIAAPIAILIRFVTDMPSLG